VVAESGSGTATASIAGAAGTHRVSDRQRDTAAGDRTREAHRGTPRAEAGSSRARSGEPESTSGKRGSDDLLDHFSSWMTPAGPRHGLHIL
jgi:hypothetical protein